MGDEIDVIASFPSGVVKRLRPFISDEETRYYLNGIHIRPMKRGVRFEATNGHILGIEYVADAKASKSIIVNIPSMAVVDSVLGKQEGVFSVYKTRDGYALGIAVRWLGGSAPPIFKNDALFMGCWIDGIFPNVDKVIPTEIDQPSCGVFNPKYISVIADAIGTKTVGLFGPSPSDPAIAFNRDKTFMAIVMPMRDDSTKGPLPDWVSLESTSND